MTDPFSVLMVTHGGEQPAFLSAALESLTAQTYPANEIILVCAGPLPDVQNQVIAQFHTRLPLIRIDLAQNQPLGPSLHEGLLHTTNELVARFDSDDICLPDRFEKQLNFLETHPEIAVLGGAIDEFMDDPEHPISNRNVPLTHADISKRAFLRTPFNHMTVLYKKSAVLAAGNYRDLLGYEDFDLWTRMLVNGAQMANLSDILVHARIGNGFHERRGGWTYAKAEWRALGEANRINPGNHLIVNILRPLRFAARLLPAAWRTALYRIVRN